MSRDEPDVMLLCVCVCVCVRSARESVAYLTANKVPTNQIQNHDSLLFLLLFPHSAVGSVAGWPVLFSALSGVGASCSAGASSCDCDGVDGIAGMDVRLAADKPAASVAFFHAINRMLDAVLFSFTALPPHAMSKRIHAMA